MCCQQCKIQSHNRKQWDMTGCQCNWLKSTEKINIPYKTWDPIAHAVNDKRFWKCPSLQLLNIKVHLNKKPHLLNKSWKDFGFYHKIISSSVYIHICYLVTFFLINCSSLFPSPKSLIYFRLDDWQNCQFSLHMCGFTPIVIQEV